MVIAAVVKNLGIYDPVARIRRVKSTYVETYDQELFLKNMPVAIDSRYSYDTIKILSNARGDCERPFLNQLTQNILWRHLISKTM